VDLEPRRTPDGGSQQAV